MKKVCFVLLCQQYRKSNTSKRIAYAINQRLHQWQDYYSFTCGYDPETECGEWEQCIIYIDNNRIISTDYHPVRVGKRNDILLSSDKAATQDTMFGLMVEALELARSNEYCEEEMILHIVCDSQDLLNIVLEDGMMRQLFMSSRRKKRYGKVYVDLVMDESCQSGEDYKIRQGLKEKLKRFQEEYWELYWHYDVHSE